MQHQEGIKMTDQFMKNDIKRQFTKFIQHFEENGEKKYLNAAKQALRNQRHHIVFAFKDFIAYDTQLSDAVYAEFYKYEPVLNQALTQFMIEHQKNEMREENKKEDDSKEYYEVSFDSGHSLGQDHSVRGLKCNQIGRLISLKGTVTRTSEVRPELKIGVFKCKVCGKLSKPITQQFKYTEPKRCSSEKCDQGSWELDMSKSEFADFQKIRVQEDPTKIPPGAMPRSIDVVLRNEFTQKGQPGDICQIVGYLCVLPEIASMLKPGERTQISTRSNETRGLAQNEGISGIKGMRDLSYKLIFQAINIKVENNQFDQFNRDDGEQEQEQKTDHKQEFDEEKMLNKIYSRLTENQINQIKSLKNSSKLYEDMAESLFPTIYGHSQIKRALLLQLLGGIHKKTKNKINIRGDVNILIVGDPSSAKSQFLKCVNKFVPRSVYTNGKTTSAAGLTASVTRDENGNVGIEAGALMLADNGICCIDQFDKMDIKDQVAIHEAMEQQTISIAKAGVYATLNARTSILAAANPMFGRYDKSKSLKNNINLSAPIMSRFDLFFVVCDESNDQIDSNLSQFIINLHRKKQHSVDPKYDARTLKRYISITKKIKPQITLEAAELLRNFYIQIRAKDKNNTNSYRVTVRQLESMIRLSEAYARLELNFKVEPRHVKEAYRLLSCSILKLDKPKVDLQDEDEENNNLSERVNQLNLHDKVFEQQIKKKQEDRKTKQVTISHELYQQIQKNILKIFKEKQNLHKTDQLEDEYQLSQENLCSYLLTLNFENGMVDTVEQTQQMKKIIHAVIKKMIREERMLMIVEDNVEHNKRMLQIHPNFVQQ